MVITIVYNVFCFREIIRQREIAILEAHVYRLSEILSEQRANTRENVQRKQVRDTELEGNRGGMDSLIGLIPSDYRLGPVMNAMNLMTRTLVMLIVMTMKKMLRTTQRNCL